MNPFPFRKDAQDTDLSRTISEIVAPKGEQPAKPFNKGDKYGVPTPPKGSKKTGTPTVSTKTYATESHSRARLERMSVGGLRELLKKYTAKAGKAGVPKGDTARELADIRGLLRSKGAGSVLDEARGGGVERICREVETDLKSIRAAAKRGAGDAIPELASQAISHLSALESGTITEAMTPCEKSALARLKAANAEDLKEKGGKAGEAAHKRLHKTLKSVLGESATKAALEDWMYSIPPAAVEALRPVMKIKSLTKRFAAITKTLKAHGFTTRFMGSMPANVVNDYYDTFFGE